MPTIITDTFVNTRREKCKSHLNENTKTCSNNQYRSLQWKIYENDYKNTLKILGDDKILDASELVRRFFGIVSFGDFIKVKSGTKTAVISCIDEATQFGEFDFMMDLNDNLIESNIDDKYILDIAGSGAYNYNCRAFSGCISLHDAINLEEKRLDTLAYKIFMWCRHRSIERIVVTYHENCGAVNLRCKNFPGLLNDKESELEEAKKCAQRLAKKINKYTIDSNIEVNIALIGSKTMCKIRPETMHNALGVCLNLDSSVSSEKLDILTSINFFNVLGLSDFEYKRDESESIDTVKHAIKNLKLVFNITQSDHGWGNEYISVQNPFIVFITFKNDFQMFQAEQIAENIKKEHIHTKIVLINTSK